jgi:hypothetical protein
VSSKTNSGGNDGTALAFMLAIINAATSLTDAQIKQNFNDCTENEI